MMAPLVAPEATYALRNPAVDWRELYDLGFSLIPIRFGSKMPAIQWAGFQTLRASWDEISVWARAGHNAGIVTGQLSGVIVLDLDSGDAIEEAERRGLPATLSVKTARGRHVYFRWPGFKVRNKVKIFDGADVRADGGYVVAAGSRHETGAEYRWETYPAWNEIADAPEWLLILLRGQDDAEAAQRLPIAAANSAYGQRALDQELTILRNASAGGRNHQLNRSAYALAQLAAGGHLDAAVAQSTLADAAIIIGLEPHEIERTIESGWQAGLREPRGPRKIEATGRPTIISARALSQMAFAELQWALPGILPEGLAILAGRPKFGKSFLGLQMAIAIATGEGKNFGVAELQAGDVLVCALEDSERRLRDRLRRLYPFGHAPERLQFATAWPRTDQAGIEELEKWCDEHNSARLIILDTWRAIKPLSNGRASSYDEDANAAAPLLEFAKRHPGLAVLVVHHVRKTEADDVFDTISGTHGLTGIFDTLMVLGRHGDGAKLAAQGRDLDGYEKALERDQRTGGWIVKGDTVPLAKTGERQELLDLLAAADGPLSLAEIAGSVSKQTGTTRHLLKFLIADGAIYQPGHGQYALAPSQFPQGAQFNEDEHPF